MATHLNPYLGFRDNARQAMEFYQSVFGGDLTLQTFGEMHASDDPAEADKIMHSQLTSANGLILMGSDTPNRMEYNQGDTISVSVNGEDEAEIRDYWSKITVGATITAPLEIAPWGDLFGMCIDKFGVTWLLSATLPKG